MGGRDEGDLNVKEQVCQCERDGGGPTRSNKI